MRRSLLLAPLLAVTALVAPATSAAPAAAADSCGGRIIWSGPLSIGGERVGELVVYYNASNGNNCAQFNRLGSARGVRGYTYAEITKCAETSPRSQSCRQVDYDFQSGSFAYYAGPVRVYSPNNCVYATGGMTWRGVTKTAFSPLPLGC